MSASRESMNFWQYLFSFNKHKNISHFFRYKVWLGSYFMQDTFYGYFNRFIGCWLFGHRNVKDIAEPHEGRLLHCFNCGRFI